jgi:16S rRNA (adenine1518-N6/adenine1519-N6)-dimethyltransferase
MASYRTGSRAGSKSTSSAYRSRTRRNRTVRPRELRAARVSARKSLGQYFLRDKRALSRIAAACELTPGETVIEIGPGLGALTDALAGRASDVIAIEKDDALSALLEERFSRTNVRVVHGDALELEPNRLLGEATRYVLAGNLPYAIVQPLLRHYLEARPKPRRIVVMVQAEVAESIVAKPGGMSLLSLAVQVYGEPKLLFRLPPSAFYPPPKVRSAVVRIDVGEHLRAEVHDVDAFFEVARAGFSTRRKQLRNALANGLDIDGTEASQLLARAGIDGTRRAQDLSLDEWGALARTWAPTR